MSLSVERVKHMLDVAKKERQESWDDMDEIGRKFSDDCVSAFEELIAIKEAEPVAWTDSDNLKVLDWRDETSMFSKHHVDAEIPLIRKPE